MHRIVTNTDDSGPGSLRQTIAAAGPGDTIGFVLTYPATITLISGELLAKPLRQVRLPRRPVMHSFQQLVCNLRRPTQTERQRLSLHNREIAQRNATTDVERSHQRIIHQISG